MCVVITEKVISSPLSKRISTTTKNKVNLTTIISGSFDLLVYCDQEVSTPAGWDETTGKLVIDSEDLRLKSFTTSIHSVVPTVSYRRT